MKKKFEADLMGKCTEVIRAAAISGNGVASIWFLYQPPKPSNREKMPSESTANEKKK